MFNVMVDGPDDCFTEGMRVLVLENVPSSSFRFLMAVLAPVWGAGYISPPWQPAWVRELDLSERNTSNC